jgi:hypothetical protein
VNLSDTTHLIQALKANGVVHFKSHDFEVKFNTSAGESLNNEVATYTAPADVPVKMDQPVENVTYDPVETKKAQDLVDLLKLKDDDLVNKLFPDGAM